LYPVRTSGYRYIAVALGLLLLVTGGLKTHAAFADDLLETSFLTNRWAVLALAEFELFLGAWLLMGYRPSAARRCALASFTCFLGFSLASALAGEQSCSCFGNLAVSPWFALTTDVAAVSALLSCRPQGDACFTDLNVAKRIFLILIIGLLSALPPALAISYDTHRPLLDASEPVVDLGVLSMGGRRSATLRLTNRGTDPVEIEAVESGCHCLTLQGAPQVVSPSQTIRMLLRLDLGKEPAFTGNLRVHVAGTDAIGRLGLFHPGDGEGAKAMTSCASYDE
jgi:hypothetical protein